MKTDYSKSSLDIQTEVKNWQGAEQKTLHSQRSIIEALKKEPKRENCLLCEGEILNDSDYQHRDVPYKVCNNCGHLQTVHKLPKGYPYSQMEAGFETIYPALDPEEYASRRDRIYLPKLKWAISRMEEAGLDQNQALKASWLEVGCGAGYFLNALQKEGATNFKGIDENNNLIAVAQKSCGPKHASITKNVLEDLSNSTANIIAAFFVLEHLEEARPFWNILSHKPKGTIFLFSVPVFGLSTIMESAFDGFAARNLDNVLHTQLYTDQSIDYILQQTRYEKAAEWLFGQDATDLCRVLSGRLSANMEGYAAAEIKQKLSQLVDKLQREIDKSRLCDARHILAVKR